MLVGVLRPFKSFEILTSQTVYPLPLFLLFGATWLEAERYKWFFKLFKILHSTILPEIVVALGIIVSFCVLAILIMLTFKAIGGRMSFICSVNVLGLASLHYSLYFLLLIGVLMTAPENSVEQFSQNNPNIIPFFYNYVYRGFVVFSVIRLLFGAVIRAEEN